MSEAIDDKGWVEVESGDDKPETVRPDAGSADGPESIQEEPPVSLKSDDIAEPWGTPPMLDAPEEAQATGSSRGLPGVDREASAVVELAFEQLTAPTPKRPKSGETVTIEVQEGETDYIEMLDDGGDDDQPEDPATIGVRPTAHVPNDAFDTAPWAPEASVRPPEEIEGSASSLQAISTLIKLEDMVGHKLSEDTKRMSESQVAALKAMLIEGKWPEDEDAASSAIILFLIEIQPRYAKSTGWKKRSFKELKRLFLDELKMSKIPSLKNLAGVLLSVPPPMPKSVRPNKP